MMIPVANKTKEYKATLTGPNKFDSQNLSNFFAEVRKDEKKMEKLIRAFCETYLIDKQQRPLRLRPLQMDIIVTIILIGGLFFFTGGTVGIIRFPDFYSRIHPAGKMDTMGVLWTMAAIALYTLNDFSIGSVLTSLKIILIVSFVFITSPTATHAILDAGVMAGLSPWTKGGAEEIK